MSNEELVQQYSRLAGHFAWDFVRRSATLGSEDAEDFASSAIVKLLQCPLAYRTEPAYVKRLILNSVIKDWRKALQNSERYTSIEDLTTTEMDA